jgi:hypothetical protein
VLFVAIELPLISPHWVAFEEVHVVELGACRKMQLENVVAELLHDSENKNYYKLKIFNKI